MVSSHRSPEAARKKTVTLWSVYHRFIRHSRPLAGGLRGTIKYPEPENPSKPSLGSPQSVKFDVCN